MKLNELTASGKEQKSFEWCKTASPLHYFHFSYTLKFAAGCHRFDASFCFFPCFLFIASMKWQSAYAHDTMAYEFISYCFSPFFFSFYFHFDSIVFSLFRCDAWIRFYSHEDTFWLESIVFTTHVWRYFICHSFDVRIHIFFCFKCLCDVRALFRMQKFGCKNKLEFFYNFLLLSFRSSTYFLDDNFISLFLSMRTQIIRILNFSSSHSSSSSSL